MKWLRIIASAAGVLHVLAGVAWMFLGDWSKGALAMVLGYSIMTWARVWIP